MGPWENWQKPDKGLNSYQGQLSWMSVEPSRERKIKYFLHPLWVPLLHPRGLFNTTKMFAVCPS